MRGAVCLENGYLKNKLKNMQNTAITEAKVTTIFDINFRMKIILGNGHNGH